MDNVVRVEFEHEKPITKKTRLPKDFDYFVGAEESKAKESRVEAFENTEEVNLFVKYFLDKHDYRTAFFVVLGCNTDLRPTDLLEYRWRHIFSGDNCSTAHYKKERKTGKDRLVILNRAVVEMAWLYRRWLGTEYNPDKFCFASFGPNKSHTPLGYRMDRSEDRIYSIEEQPVNVRSLARLLRGAAKDLGLYRKDRRISTYSLRKTALNAPVGLVKGVDLDSEAPELMKRAELAMLMANHSKLSTTLEHYVPVKDRIMQKTFGSMNLGLEAILEHKEEIGWNC